MKVFDLVCDSGHRFEGWFDSLDHYHAQLERGLLACPLCESVSITRRPSAARLNLGAASDPGPPRGGGAQATPAVHEPPADRIQAALLRLARDLIRRSEDVGDRFVEEARRIHAHEAPERAIRGVATPQDAQALVDDGIPVMPLPFGDLLKKPLN